MENEKESTKISGNRTWHTPELRKNTVREDTLFEVGPRIDGNATGSSSF